MRHTCCCCTDVDSGELPGLFDIQIIASMLVVLPPPSCGPPQLLNVVDVRKLPALLEVCFYVRYLPSR